MQIQSCEDAIELWSAYAEQLEIYLRQKTKDIAVAQDLRSEVLLKVCNSCCSGVDIESPKSWLFRIAHNLFVDHIRDYQRTQQIDPISQTAIPDVYQKLTFFIEPLIDLLPAKYALPLRLADLEQLPQQAIAEQLGLSLTATKSRIQRARKLLLKEIETCFYLEQDDKNGLQDFKLKDCCTSLQNFQKNSC
ncbi:MAG: sigma-70 family RNA polymerase sigma factor [Saprospiraceae bacterium]